MKIKSSEFFQLGLIIGIAIGILLCDLLYKIVITFDENSGGWLRIMS
jgi:hypothetical protein